MKLRVKMLVNKQELGSWLLEQRKASGLTQQEASDFLGYDNYQSISNWERGVSSPPLVKLMMLVDIYEIPIKKFRREMHSFFSNTLDIMENY